MQNIKSYILESDVQEYKGSSFDAYRYEKKDWDKWLKLVDKDKFGKDLLLGNYDVNPELTLVYKVNYSTKKMEHIATYNEKTQTLYCDDINLFGN